MFEYISTLYEYRNINNMEIYKKRNKTLGHTVPYGYMCMYCALSVQVWTT